MSNTPLLSLASQYQKGMRAGIVSICSAHPLVIEATLCHAANHDRPVLIEATCNQVNHQGGYTSMTPADFRGFVEGIAADTGFDCTRLILGGDHLGTIPWKHLNSNEAMHEANEMVAAYAAAGFSKIHLDTSTGCADDPPHLDDTETAKRAALLAATAEKAAKGAGHTAPVYVIGTEVPVPGGAQEALDTLEPTHPDAARETIDVHRTAFSDAGLDDAFGRAIALVVQPGVEFGSTTVIAYDPDAAKALCSVLSKETQFIYEAHSTDYQTEAALADLVRDGFSILKVGPELTFALREAYYGLSHIGRVMFGEDAPDIQAAFEEVMLDAPKNWERYYEGTPNELYLQRHFSFSDRIRYYWPEANVQNTAKALKTVFGDTRIPLPLIRQYMGTQFDAVCSGTVTPTAHALILNAVMDVIRRYDAAITG